MTRANQRLTVAVVAVVGFVPFTAPAAQTVWSGYDVLFEKPDGANWTLEANQDRITSNVWITRASSRGPINFVTETTYTRNVSPEDTEWATGEAVDWQSLTFTNWETWRGATGSTDLSFLGENAVVHLITDDIYLDIRFESWSCCSAGGFSYVRARDPASPVEPASWSAIKNAYDRD